MTRTCDPIEDDPPYHHVRVKTKTSQDHCGYRARALGTVKRKNDRRLNKLCKLGRAGSPFQIDSVIEPTISLYDRGPVNNGVPSKRGKNLVPACKKGVKITAGLTGRKSQPPCVDIIRTLFERGYEYAPLSQGRNKPQRKKRLSGTAPQGGDNQPGKDSHSFIIIIYAPSSVPACLPTPLRPIMVVLPLDQYSSSSSVTI